MLTVGQFKDDQLQDHSHYQTVLTNGTQGITDTSMHNFDSNIPNAQSGGIRTGRYGTTTRGKRKAVKYIIKVL